MAYTSKFTGAQIDALLEGIQSGGAAKPSSAKKNGVNFRDYDGSILHAYTVEEAAALTDLPALPSHNGLICQGWNWTLEQIQSLNRGVDVGPMYVTDDGATRLYISLVDPTDLIGYARFAANAPAGTEIDWGDGEKTIAQGDMQQYDHTYAAVGDYVISIQSGSKKISLGGDGNSYNVAGPFSQYNKKNVNKLQAVQLGSNVTRIGSNAFIYCYSLASITIPDSVTSIGSNVFHTCPSLASITIPDSVTSIGDYVFRNCPSLASITIPDGITSIGYYVFYGCYSLTSITIPDSVTSIGSNAFYGCYSLASITIPDSVTSIDSNVFHTCYSLASITIPDSVTSIGDYVFRNCGAVLEYHLLPVSPPTLSNTNAFDNISADCIIYVPVGSLSVYQAATNWSTYASQMKEEGT